MNGWIDGSLYKASNRGFCEHYPPFLDFMAVFLLACPIHPLSCYSMLPNCAILFFLFCLFLMVLDHQTIGGKHVVRIMIRVGGNNKGISSFFQF